MNRNVFENSSIDHNICTHDIFFKQIGKLSGSFSNSGKMPVLFLGHGSPMNGIEDNEFVRGFKEQAKHLDKPNAIIVVSAHWETRGTL